MVAAEAEAAIGEEATAAEAAEGVEGAGIRGRAGVKCVGRNPVSAVTATDADSHTEDRATHRVPPQRNGAVTSKQAAAGAATVVGSHTGDRKAM